MVVKYWLKPHLQVPAQVPGTGLQNRDKENSLSMEPSQMVLSPIPQVQLQLQPQVKVQLQPRVQLQLQA